MSWIREQLGDGLKSAGSGIVNILMPASLKMMKRSRMIRSYIDSEDVSYTTKFKAEDAYKNTEYELEISGLRAVAVIGLLSCPASYGSMEALLVAGFTAADWATAYVLCKGLDSEISRKYKNT